MLLPAKELVFLAQSRRCDGGSNSRDFFDKTHIDGIILHHLQVHIHASSPMCIVLERVGECLS